MIDYEGPSVKKHIKNFIFKIVSFFFWGGGGGGGFGENKTSLFHDHVKRKLKKTYFHTFLGEKIKLNLSPPL